MTSTALESPARRLAEIRLQKIRKQREQNLARNDVSYLLDHVGRMVDEKTGEVFQFHLNDPESGWNWQREVLDTLRSEQKTIILKARQLGITWLCAGLQLAEALTRPGTLHLIYRQKEDDAAEIIERIWQMFTTLPEHLKMGVRVLTPRTGHHPFLAIELEHPDGRVSRLLGMASTSASGHGHTAASVLLDEAARIEKLREIWKAITPVVGTKGRVYVVSTANGMSDPSGEGNFYHRLWVTAEEKGLQQLFLGWDKHPERDQEWYENSIEVRSLDTRERAEQYPSSANEAFALTADIYFDQDALQWYIAQGTKKPEYRFEFRPRLQRNGQPDPRQARPEKLGKGVIRVYREPEHTVVYDDETGQLGKVPHQYAIGVDVATGRGADSSAVYVIDLSDMAICAEIHAKIDPDKLAYQLHFLGRWYHTARIAIETSAGFGEAVIVPLRDGRDGRPPYPNLYRHRHDDRVDPGKDTKHYGYPVNAKTRSLALSCLSRALRERALPWITESVASQCSTFVYWDVGTSPRAAAGCHDDCVLGLSIALDLYRRYGYHPDLFRHRPRKSSKSPYPWLAA